MQQSFDRRRYSNSFNLVDQTRLEALPLATPSEIDRLGDRLRTETLSDPDLRELDVYRRAFAEGYNRVISILQETEGLNPTGRPAKSTTAIVEKLKRQSTRLSQMQDIAGCRVVVGDVLEQDAVVERIKLLFDSASVLDRRERPSFG